MKNLNYILLVDDDKIANHYHKLLIKRNLNENIPVKEAYDGKEALEFISQNELPYLIFLDINMPGMNGFEFLDSFKSFPNKEKAKIVMLTSSLNDKDKEKAYSYKEVDMFVNKPLHKLNFKSLLMQG